LLKKHFKVNVGLSDHTLGIGVSIAAIALGAMVIEKHLTLNRTDGGPDSAFSLEPKEFKSLVDEGKKAFESLGKAEWQISESEKESRRLRRSLYIVKNVKKGELVSSENLKAIRPGEGCSPKYLNTLLGKTYKENYDLGTPMNIGYAQ
jgi:N-acetylneuraminate synthase